MILSEKYRVIKDSTGTFVLQFFEDREREKKDNTKEVYEYIENYYYPTLKHSLIAFVNKYVGDSIDVKDIIERIDRVEEIIKSL